MPPPEEARPESPLVCAECGRPSEPGAEGWRAYLDVDGAAVTFCPECAEEQFPRDGRTSRER